MWRSTSNAMRVWPRPQPVLALGWHFCNAERQHHSLGAARRGANLPGRPVDMWAIGFADRLRFPRFPISTW